MVADDLLERLDISMVAIAPTDSVGEAGRKILLVNFHKMLQHEDGSRTGEDIEDVHQMRVAIRRMRSALRLAGPYYRAKFIRPFGQHLKHLARVLGRVRDLDVMLDNLAAYRLTQDEAIQMGLDDIMAQLNKKREKARAKLNALFDSSDHQQFLTAFTDFVTTPQKWSNSMVDDTEPYQVRHVAPVLIHRHLASVRAYDALVENAEHITPPALHSLRIEFKRLRYTVAFFAEILGSSAQDFIESIKDMQDYLGHTNDAVVAHEWLDNLKGLSGVGIEARNAYLAHLEAEVTARIAQFPEMWANFNKRTVQRKLSDALLVLR